MLTKAAELTEILGHAKRLKKQNQPLTLYHRLALDVERLMGLKSPDAPPQQPVPNNKRAARAENDLMNKLDESPPWHMGDRELQWATLRELRAISDALGATEAR